MDEGKMAALELARVAMARAELWEFGVAILFFHASEYALAVAFHGRNNVNLSCECSTLSSMVFFELNEDLYSSAFKYGFLVRL